MHLREREHGSEVAQWVDAELLLDDRDLVVLRRVAERRAQEEAVELRLRERERPLLLDRVLGREHEERLRKLAGDAVDRHLLLGHRLEERGLRLRHRAVDLVDEEDVREHRSRPELEVAVALVEDREAGDVRRLEIGRALDPRERSAVDAACDRAGEDGLRRSRDVLQQHVAAADERGQDEPDLLGLPAHDRLDVAEQPCRDVRGGRARRVQSSPSILLTVARGEQSCLPCAGDGRVGDEPAGERADRELSLLRGTLRLELRADAEKEG